MRYGALHYFFMFTTMLIAHDWREPITIYKGITQQSQHSESLNRLLWSRYHEHELVSILEKMKGIHITQSGGVGSTISLFVQGGNANHVLVLYDGLRIMDPSTSDGSFHAGGLSIVSVDDVTLHTGPLSRFWGGNAVSGALSFSHSKGVQDILPQQLFYKNGSTRHFARMTTSHGTHDTQHQTLNMRGQHQRVHYNMSVDHLKTQGYKVYPVYARTNIRGHLADAFQRGSAQGRVDIDVHDRGTFTWNAHESGQRQFYKRDQDNPFYVGRTQRRYHSLAYASHHTPCWGGHYRQKILGGYVRTRRHDRETPHVIDDGLIVYGVRRQLTSQHEVSYKNYRLLAEVEYEHELMNQKNIPLKAYADITRDHFYKHAHRHSVMISPVYETDLIGGRHHVVIKGVLRRDKHTLCKTMDTGMIGGEYTSPMKTRLSFSYATAYKAPTLYQRYYHSPWHRPNFELQPERAYSMRYGIHQPMGHYLTCSGQYFTQNFKNMIGYVHDPLTFKGYFDNTHKAQIRGCEGDLSWVYREFSVTGRCTHLWTHDLKTQQSFLRRPHHTYGLDFIYTSDRWTHCVSFAYKGAWLDKHPVYFTTEKAQGYYQVDFGSTYHINTKHDIFVKVNNVTDRRQREDPLGYVRSGIDIHVGISLIF